MVLQSVPVLEYTPTSGSLWRLSELPVVWFTLVPLSLGLAAGRAGWRSAKVEPMQLTWTGQVWQARPVSDEFSDAGPAVGQVGCLSGSELMHGIESPVCAPWRACEPALMIDLGAWILLRLRWPDYGSPQRTGEVWLSVPASQVDPWSWHGLRVALHCARSSAQGLA